MLLSAEFAGSRLRQVSRIRAAFTRALCRWPSVSSSGGRNPASGSMGVAKIATILRSGPGLGRSSTPPAICVSSDDSSLFAVAPVVRCHPVHDSALQGVPLVFVQDLPALRQLDGRSKKAVYVEISFDCARVRPIRTLIGGSCLQRRFCIWSHARQQRRTKDTGACANLDGTLPVSFRHSAASLALALSSCAGACVRLVAL